MITGFILRKALSLSTCCQEAAGSGRCFLTSLNSRHRMLNIGPDYNAYKEVADRKKQYLDPCQCCAWRKNARHGARLPLLVAAQTSCHGRIKGAQNGNLKSNCGIAFSEESTQLHEIFCKSAAVANGASESIRWPLGGSRWTSNGRQCVSPMDHLEAGENSQLSR